MNNKVLILGSKGTLGQELVKVFRNDYEVTAWDKDVCDVTSPELKDKILQLHPDFILNAIAYNAVDKMETDPVHKKLGYTLNADIPGKLAEISKELKSTFVHYSSNYVFTGDNKSGYSESDVCLPINEYGKSKLAGEQAVAAAGGRYYIIRLARLFGIRGTGETSKRTFVEIMLSELDKQELPVGNTELSNITYSVDLANLSKTMVESDLTPGIYHGANEGGLTWYDWGKEIFSILGKGPKVIPVETMTPKITKHPLYTVLLNTKLPPQRPWQEALKEFLNANN